MLGARHSTRIDSGPALKPAAAPYSPPSLIASSDTLGNKVFSRALRIVVRHDTHYNLDRNLPRRLHSMSNSSLEHESVNPFDDGIGRLLDGSHYFARCLPF